jgi:hypothetical protein
MMTWPKPSTVKGTRRIGYYRKFTHHYGIIDQALTHMLKNDSFRWTPAVEQAFEELKRAMASGPVLALPDFSQQFIAECDASGLGLGAVLMQGDRPIAFSSQALHGKNMALSTHEKKCWLKAVQKWRPHLFVRKDQKWLVKLLGFDFQIHYKKGKEHSVADALSRRFGIQTWAISSPMPN